MILKKDEILELRTSAAIAGLKLAAKNYGMECTEEDLNREREIQRKAVNALFDHFRNPEYLDLGDQAVKDYAVEEARNILQEVLTSADPSTRKALMELVGIREVK